MGPDRLDKFIKNQVEQHKTPTDPDLLWQKIQAKQNLEEKPKRRFLIFWLLGGALLLTSLGLWYIFASTDTNLSFNENENPIENTTINNAAKQTTDTKQTGTTKSNQTNSANQVTDSAKNTTPSNNLSTDNKKSSKTNPRNTTTDLNKLKSNKTNTNTNRSTKNERLATAKTKTPNTTNAESYPPAAPTPPSAISNLTKDTENQLPIVSTTTTDQSEEQKKDEKEASNKNNTNNTKVNSNAFAKSELLLITALNNLLDDQMIANQFVEAQKETKDFPPYEYNKRLDIEQSKPWNFSTGLAYTYGKAPRSLATRNDTSEQYLLTRNDMETSLDAIRIDLDFRLENNSGFYLKSGIQYEQINERFDAFTLRDSTIIDPNQVIAITYAMNGSSSETLGEGEQKVILWNRKKRYNRYHSIDIPFLIGYNATKEDRRLGWFVEGGASVNLWFKARGEVYDTSNQPIRLEDNTNLFKTRTGISLITAAGANYRLANNFSLWASPTLKYHLSSITSNENTLDQKYLNIGLQVGIRYHWIK